MKRRQRKKINIFKLLSIILIILFIISVPTVVKKLIKITKIECSSQFGNCDKILGDRLQVIGSYKIVKKQIEVDLNKNIQVDNYLIQYKIPSTIKIDVVVKKQKYAINNQSSALKNLSNKYYLVDKDGIVLEISDESNLPFLVNNSDYNLGQNISDKDKFALQVLEKARIINTVSKAEIKNEILELIIENGIIVKFPLEGDIDVLTGSLRLIFSRLNDETGGIRIEDVHEIDLRFKNPVLR